MVVVHLHGQCILNASIALAEGLLVEKLKQHQTPLSVCLCLGVLCTLCLNGWKTILWCCFELERRWASTFSSFPVLIGLFVWLCTNKLHTLFQFFIPYCCSASAVLVRVQSDGCTCIKQACPCLNTKVAKFALQCGVVTSDCWFPLLTAHTLRLEKW